MLNCFCLIRFLDFYIYLGHSIKKGIFWTEDRPIIYTWVIQ